MQELELAKEEMAQANSAFQWADADHIDVAIARYAAAEARMRAALREAMRNDARKEEVVR